jgi:cobalamin biosynthesis protein CbiD
VDDRNLRRGGGARGLRGSLHRDISDPAAVSLPNGMRPAFSLALEEKGPGWARAGIAKDAEDDPDVMHGTTRM